MSGEVAARWFCGDVRARGVRAVAWPRVQLGCAQDNKHAKALFALFSDAEDLEDAQLMGLVLAVVRGLAHANDATIIEVRGARAAAAAAADVGPSPQTLLSDECFFDFLSCVEHDGEPPRFSHVDFFRVRTRMGPLAAE